jgi:DGQHR domain-containing protein
MRKISKIKTKKKKKKRLSPEERRRKTAERFFKNNINTVFKNASFTQVPTRNKNLEFLGVKGEIDSIFIYENIIVISEDTCSASSHIGDHLRKKAIYYDHLRKNKPDLINYLSREFPSFRKHIQSHNNFDVSDYNLIFLYCSRNPCSQKLKSQNSKIIFLDYTYLRYFLRLSRTIHKSTKYELFKFLGLEKQDVGIDSGLNHKKIEGFLLPEARSGFDTEHKVVTFYIDPLSLLELSYVLRKDASWLDVDSLYQRLLIPSKIRNIREFIANNKRVFINNIIVTLPDQTKLLDEKDREVTADNPSSSKAQPIYIQVPLEYNAIGIIDGQHRVFAYHEGEDKYERIISKERIKQNLLVTGIMYPKGQKRDTKLKFESKLFMEINDKQSRVRPDLRQAIRKILYPFDNVSIAKAVISELAADGPLADKLEVHFFDTSKIKTTSIVSYGLIHLVKTEGNDSLFKVWKHSKKLEIQKGRNKTLLTKYVTFCAEELNDFISAYQFELSKIKMFTLDKKISRALTSTSINGLIFCMRRIVENDKKRGLSHFKKGFENLKIDFAPENFSYRSSHWKSLGDEIYNQCFKN